MKRRVLDFDFILMMIIGDYVILVSRRFFVDLLQGKFKLVDKEKLEEFDIQVGKLFVFIYKREDQLFYEVI